MWLVVQESAGGPLPAWILQDLTVEFDPASAVMTGAEALAAVVRRHEGLRTTVGADPAGSPVQIVHDDVRPDVETVVTDAAGFREAKRALLDRLSRDPFDLGGELPFRAGLVDCGTRQALVIVFQHIAMDRWGLRLVYEELLEALTRGRVDRPRPMQPREVAAREDSPEGRRRNEMALTYLEQCLQSAPQSLFTESENDGEPHFTSTYLHSPAGHRAARQIADRCQVTEPAVWLSVLAVYYALSSGVDGCRFLMQAVNRVEKSELTVVGKMARTVPVFFDLSGNPGFFRIAQRVLRTTVRAMRSANFSNGQYDEIVRRVQDRRGIHFRDQVFVNYLQELAPELAADDEPDGISGRAVTRESTHGPSVEFTVLSGRDVVTLDVDRRYFKDPEGVLHWLDSLLVQLADAGDIPLGELPMPPEIQPTAGLVRCDNCWVSLPEIAAALESHPAVRSARVSVSENEGAERLVAHVHPAHGDVPVEELRAHLTQRLPDSSTLMVPHHFVLTHPGTPLTPTPANHP
ncbi:AMP-binding enzyme C-terminal domain-containing protein [Streptomyces aidingensis]|uniref:AMP-binding enzyme C-terminal domain-containing protein n=2 Tax=Streptomyces aidingensis TaxID=910347 RepID=A0A1I1KJI0_9ACTN|nr:AMP-binding enzyme C-terminal domain-containing protein [Streptomyces aidingensis]